MTIRWTSIGEVDVTPEGPSPDKSAFRKLSKRAFGPAKVHEKPQSAATFFQQVNIGFSTLAFLSRRGSNLRRSFFVVSKRLALGCVRFCSMRLLWPTTG